MYATMTVVQLKEELRKRKASTSGKKAALIERLEAYDRHNNFGVEDVEEDDVFYVPGAETFRDINANSSLPQLTKHHIQAFVERFQTQFNKGREMYESRFLLTARVSINGNMTYIQCQCKAQMKKLMYVVNVKLDADGSIEQSHCECAAGSGVDAHCKHIMVLLHGIEDMVRTKTIILHQVCTQKLMDFKRPRKIFFDSPMKAERLPSKRKKSVNYLPLKEEDVMDSYQDYVNNLAISYGESTMPILQTIRPANTYAAVHDHHYVEKSPEDQVLEDLLLKDVTVSKIQDVELRTRRQNKCKEWHECRSHRITASNFYTVVHSKTETRKHLAEKILFPKSFTSRATSHRQLQEPLAIQKYSEINNLVIEPCGLFISESHPFLGATPDGLLGEETIIEVKCPYTAKNCMISIVTVPYLELIDNNYVLKKKHPYYCQIQGQLFCTNKKYCNLIIYTIADIKVVYINRDEPFISEMVQKLDEFYTTYYKKAVLEKVLYKSYGNLKTGQ